ncbi:MAG: peroxiredoxin [Polyangiaceae bacterium]
MTLAVGDRAPDFTLPSSRGESVTLSARLGRGPVVLYFYPKDGTTGCTAQACSFRDRSEDFADAGADVLGVSSDGVASHERFVQKHDLPMTLLSDTEGKVRSLYGVRPTLGFLPGRATFVIDKDGIVRHVFVSQFRFGRHADEALEVVRRLRAEAEPAVSQKHPA